MMGTTFRLTHHERRVLEILPKPLHVMVLAHHYVDEVADLIQECAVEVCKLNADDVVDFQQIYDTARSRVRRFTQDAAHYGQSDDFGTTEAPENEPTPLTHADVVRQVADEQHCCPRRAQQIVKGQIDRTKRNGDLFLGGEDGDEQP